MRTWSSLKSKILHVELDVLIILFINTDDYTVCTTIHVFCIKLRLCTDHHTTSMSHHHHTTSSLSFIVIHCHVFSMLSLSIDAVMRKGRCMVMVAGVSR